MSNLGLINRIAKLSVQGDRFGNTTMRSLSNSSIITPSSARCRSRSSWEKVQPQNRCDNLYNQSKRSITGLTNQIDFNWNNSPSSISSTSSCLSSPMITPSRHLSTYPVPVQNDDTDINFQSNGTVIATGPDGSRYAIPLKPLGKYSSQRHAPKIKPHVVKKRTSNLRTVTTSIKNIRHSPWRLNLICQFVAKMTVNDALLQLKFVQKVKAPLVTDLIRNAMNTAKQQYGLLPSQLEVEQCFATVGTPLKRIKMMGRGRHGKMRRKHSHMRVILREIDYPLKIMQSVSINQRNKWVSKMIEAEEDMKTYRGEIEEIERLEREVEEMELKKKKD